MSSTSVVIVGAALSGLYAAYLLQQQGIHDYVVLEARSRPGGRLLAEWVGEARFDLGTPGTGQTCSRNWMRSSKAWVCGLSASTKPA